MTSTHIFERKIELTHKLATSDDTKANQRNHESIVTFISAMWLAFF